MNPVASRMTCECHCQVKGHHPPLLQKILLSVGPDCSTWLTYHMGLLCARVTEGAAQHYPTKWFWACDCGPWLVLTQELWSLLPWKCRHLSVSFLALDILCSSSRHKVLKQWKRKWALAIGWYGQQWKSCPVRDCACYLRFDCFFRCLKTIEIIKVSTWHGTLHTIFRDNWAIQVLKASLTVGQISQNI